MKKSYLAVGVLATLGVIWLGGTWATGMVAEKKIRQFHDEQVKFLQESYPSLGLSITLGNYQRGFFSSQFEYDLEWDNKELFKTPLKIRFDNRLDHGPFPLSQLAKLNILPTMAVMHQTLPQQESAKKLFELTKGESLYQAVTNFSYFGGFDTDVSVIPLEFSKDGVSMKFSGAKLSGHGDLKLKQPVDFMMDVGEFKIVNTNDNINVLMQNILLKGISGPYTENKLPEASTSTFQIGSFQVNNSQADANFLLNDLKIVSDNRMDSTKKFYEGNVEYSAADVKIKQQSFGSPKLNITYKKLDVEAINQLISIYQTRVKALAEQGQGSDQLANDQEFIMSLVGFVGQVLQHEPELGIEPFSWKNSKGESQYQLNVKLQPLDMAAAMRGEMNPEHMAWQMLKEVNMNMTLSEPMLQELVGRGAMVNSGQSESDAMAEAQQQVQMLKSVGMMYRVLKSEGTNLTSSIRYADKVIDINGQKTPIEQFMKQLGQGGAMMEEEEAE